MVIKNKTEEYEEDIANLLSENDYVLVDFKIVKQKKSTTLKIVIHNNKGISHNDCINVTKLVQQYCEEQSILLDCAIDVSSPGINRVLKTLREINAFQGRKIAISYLNSNDKIVQEIGYLQSCNTNQIQILSEAQTEKSFPSEIIKKIRLADL